MAEDFVGVPRDDWQQLRQDLRDLRLLGWLLAMVLGLLVSALIGKGVLTGWGDLLKVPLP